MANYTTELRTICESLTGNVLGSYTQTNEIIASARTQIFDFDYPIYNPEYKSILETKIIRHYYTYEIGLETVGLWKLKLETKMNEIMPYFNQLYESADLKYDILHDYYIEKLHKGGREENTKASETSDLQHAGTSDTTLNGTDEKTLSGADTTDYTSEGIDNRNIVGSGTSENTHNGTTDGTDDKTTETKFSDTPQGSLSGVDRLEYLTTFTAVTDNDKISGSDESKDKGSTTNDTSDILDYNQTDKNTVTYGKKESDKNTNTNETLTSDSTKGSIDRNEALTTTDQFVEVIRGKTGGRLYPEMITAYRETLLNIDLLIIKELRDLFMLTW